MNTSELKTAIAEAREKLKKGVLSNEPCVEGEIVRLILNALGWHMDSSGELLCQQKLRGGGVPDWTLRSGDPNRAIVETKGPRVSLDGKEPQKQLAERIGTVGIGYAILTNGAEWWFYAPRIGEYLEDTKCASVDITVGTIDKIASLLAKLLSKETVQSGDALRSAVRMQAEEHLRWQMPSLILEVMQAPPNELVELLRTHVRKVRKAKLPAVPTISIVKQATVDLACKEMVLKQALRGKAVQEYAPQKRLPALSLPLVLSIGEDTYDLQSWSAVLVRTVDWLVTKGLDVEEKPMPKTRKPVVCKDKTRLRAPAPAANGYYVDTAFTAEETITRAIWLLEQADIRASRLRICYVSLEPSQQLILGEIAEGEAPIEPPKQGQGRLVGSDPAGNSTVRAVLLRNERIEVKHWNEVLTATANWLLGRGEQLPMSRVGGRKALIGTTSKGMRNPHRLSNGCYVETGFSARECVAKAQWLMQQSGYSEEDLQVEYEEPGSG